MNERNLITMKKKLKKIIRRVVPALIIFCTLFGITLTGVSAHSITYLIVWVGLFLMGATLILTEDF